MTGISFSRSCPAIRDRTSKPSKSGITISSSTREIPEPNCLSRLMHWAPSEASSSWKSLPRIPVRISRFMGESSTMRTVGRGWLCTLRTFWGSFSVTTIFFWRLAWYIRLSASLTASSMDTPPMLEVMRRRSKPGTRAPLNFWLMSRSLRAKSSAGIIGRIRSSSSPP